MDNLSLFLGIGFVALAALILLTLWLVLKSRGQVVAHVQTATETVGSALRNDAESRQRAITQDVQLHIVNSGERLSRDIVASQQLVGKLQVEVVHHLSKQTTDTLDRLADLQRALTTRQDQMRQDVLEQMLGKMAEQARANQNMLQTTLQTISQQLGTQAQTMTSTVNERLSEISAKVNERLEDGFKRTNETFVNVMQRLATIDEAQKKIDSLTTNVVSLQALLGDKRSRGAFGEVQLEAIVRNLLPPNVYSFQASLNNGTRADCLLDLPAPTGKIVIDSKFPLENFHRAIDGSLSQTDRELAQREFARDVKRHVDDIAKKYIVPGETGEGAMLFVPAEAVFAEIHAYHPEVIDHAQTKRVWVVSPTTLMAVLNTVRAVLRDVEMREQAKVIQSAIAALDVEFSRFDQRMEKLASDIARVSKDVDDVHVTSKKITKRFGQITRADLTEFGEAPESPPVLPGT
jgi:DNA recombination protein RmuC